MFHYKMNISLLKIILIKSIKCKKIKPMFCQLSVTYLSATNKEIYKTIFSFNLHKLLPLYTNFGFTFKTFTNILTDLITKCV